MSAPPPGLPNGQNPRPNPGGPHDPNGRPRPPPMKRRPRADPLVARKKPPSKNAPARPGASSSAGPSRSQASSSVNPEAQTTALLSRIAEHRTKAAANGGWTEPLPAGAREWKIVTTKRAMLDGMRHHIMKFHSTNPKATIDPTNQEEFTRPITLQRRDPRQPAAGRDVKQPEAPQPEPNPVDEKEAERLAKLKADKEAWKAMEAAKSAPSLKDPNAPQRIKQPKQEERGVSFYRTPRSQQEKKQMDLRYEEALPWHIEDVDGKNVWVGSYVAPMSETHVCLVATHDGKFAMVPLEKWYKFVAKPNFDHMKIEEAEALTKSNGVSRWIMQSREKQAKQKEMDETRQYFHGPARIKTESATFRNASMEERFDHDQIDFEGDEFQDDDEAPTFEPDGDEDQKTADDRIRREQLGANLFGDADEGKIDKEELEQRLLDEVRRKEGKKMTKALIKREKETIYQDDSDSGYDPFESSSSEDDSDEEKDKDKQGEEDKEEKDDDKDKPPSSQDPSSQKQDGKDGKDKHTTSSKGTLTPSGKQKQADATKKGKSLKRPGSPNLSESSGTESSRKKKQKKNAGNSVQASRSGTPLPPGVAGQKHKLGMGSGSDGEATGGEMSDGAKRQKKLKILGTGARATPTGSRAGSPVPASASAASPTSPGARAGSPGQTDPIQVSELRNVLPPDGGPGIRLSELLKAFSGRVGDGPGQTPKLDFIQLVKANTIYGPDKLMRRKD